MGTHNYKCDMQEKSNYCKCEEARKKLTHYSVAALCGEAVRRNKKRQCLSLRPGAVQRHSGDTQADTDGQMVNR